MHFRSPIDSKSQELIEFKSGTSHITHYTIHPPITYKFEVWQNIRDNNDCFFGKKKYQKLNKNLCPFKEKKRINAIKSQRH